MIFIGLGLILVLATAGFLIFRGMRAFFYPAAPPMPPVVAESMDQVLVKLEKRLQDKAPKVAAALKPGISAEQIAALEKRGDVQLSEEIRKLYQWHDGMDRGQEIIPGHDFLPLDEVIAKYLAYKKQLADASYVQRAAHEVFAGHSATWLTLCDDGAGDGYFFDPARRASEGAVFYHFAEMRDYHFFPSLSNLMAAIDHCYETGAFYVKSDGTLDENFDLSTKVWPKFSAEPQR